MRLQYIMIWIISAYRVASFSESTKYCGVFYSQTLYPLFSHLTETLQQQLFSLRVPSGGGKGGFCTTEADILKSAWQFEKFQKCDRPLFVPNKLRYIGIFNQSILWISKILTGNVVFP